MRYPFHRLAAPIAAFGFASLSAIPSLAADDHALDGAWFAGVRQDRGEFSAQATLVGGVGDLELETKRWSDIGSMACRYAFTHTGGAVDQMYFNAARSTDLCPRELSISFEPGADRVGLAFANQPGFPRLELTPFIAPVPDSLKAVAPEAADVLGVRLTMTREEAEAILVKEKGYTHDTQHDQTYTGAGWQSVTSQYYKGEIRGTPDVVTVVYSTVAEDIPSPPEYAVAIQRRWSLGEDTKMTKAALDDAINAKYGVETFFGDRQYDHGGNLLSKDERKRFCVEGSRATVPFEIVSPGASASMNLDPRCGYQAEISTQGNVSTGLATGLKILLTSGDVAMDDYWIVYGQERLSEINAYIEANAGLSTEKPNL